MSNLVPLNGQKTHPLSRHALAKLAQIANAPIPTQSLNPGVVNRFHREGLTETVDLKSPFSIHQGGTCRHERITDAGRAMLPTTPASPARSEESPASSIGDLSEDTKGGDDDLGRL